jgi:ethylmalonyl-CoA/methylmalonyl-CoA decarboxylase
MDLQGARLALGELAQSSTVATGTVRLELTGPVAELWLDHPRPGNAVTVNMMVELADAVLALRAWSGAALMVRSAGERAFCAGGHLKDVRQVIDAPERARTMALAMGATLDALLDLPVTSVAAVHGLAVGGGAELLTAVDYRAFGPGGRVHFVHGQLGIAPGWGGTGRLVHHIGRARALGVLHQASCLGPGEAESCGLASVVGPDAHTAALEALEPVLSIPTAAARALKRQVAAARPRRDLAAEADAFAAVWGGPDHQAALSRLVRHTR